MKKEEIETDHGHIHPNPIIFCLVLSEQGGITNIYLSKNEFERLNKNDNGIKLIKIKEG